jgi:hypothetical protein
LHLPERQPGWPVTTQKKAKYHVTFILFSFVLFPMFDSQVLPLPLHMLLNPQRYAHQPHHTHHAHHARYARLQPLRQAPDPCNAPPRGPTRDLEDCVIIAVREPPDRSWWTFLLSGRGHDVSEEFPGDHMVPGPDNV